MKLYPLQVRAVVHTLKSIFIDGHYADKAIQHTLKSNPKAGSRDRAFIASTTYNIVRWWRLLMFLNGEHKPITETVLWEVFAVYWLNNGHTLPDWKEFTGIDKSFIEKRKSQVASTPAIRESIPDWLNQLGTEEMGAEPWIAQAAAMNTEAPVYIRANNLKTDTKKLLNQLEQRGIDAVPDTTTTACIRITKRTNLTNLDLFKKGFFEIQDVGSQRIGTFLQVSPRMTVIDACAGAGGKTLQIASLMQNQGRLIAMDLEAWKLNELKKRGKRAGVDIINTKAINSPKALERFANTADRLLLDVPCSGLGVLRRKPDSKWKLTPEFIDKVKKVQSDILNTYPAMLKPGGLMVYATCSILPSENHLQVKSFLENHPEFELLDEAQLLPATYPGDGFYMALMRKNAYQS